MVNQKPLFTYDDCSACGICIQACPVSALSLSKTHIDEYKKVYPELSGRPCTGCTLCEKACPMNVIIMESI